MLFVYVIPQRATQTTSRHHKQPLTTMTTKSERNLALTGALGVLIAAYGAYVEHQKKTLQDDYSALCDSKYFSCSKVRNEHGYYSLAWCCLSIYADAVVMVDS